MDVSGILSASLNSTGPQASALEHARRDAELADFQAMLTRIIEARELDEKVERAQIRQAAEMFEAYFLQMMFREMRKTNFDEGGIIPRSNAERIFTEMLDETIADQAAAQGGFGLADMLYAQMTTHLRNL
jgi:Rod binding domain-containing protein